VIGSYLVAAIITPGDLFVTSVALMVPLYLLYELSIGLSWLVFRKRQRKAESEIESEVPA
jgi:Sec-independent protein secretion pathway component TatC